MVLSDVTIRERIRSDALVTGLYGKESIQPASVDLRLSDSWVWPVEFGTTVLSAGDAAYNESCAKYFTLMPGCFVLATTWETINLPSDLAAFVEGRSSVGRQGLFVENAGWVDPGFSGEITLELYNASPNPIVLESGTRVAQIIFCQMTAPSAHPYHGKYNGQSGATVSRMSEDANGRSKI